MVAPQPRKDAWSTRAFSALLALYPAAFRDDYHREMTLVFLDRYRRATRWSDRAGLWFDALTGVITEAPKEHGRVILQDLRYASRVLRKHAIVSATIVITLGLGIGANATVFSVLNAALLRTLPVHDPDRLFTVNTGPATALIPENARLSGPTFNRLRRAAPEGVSITAMSRVVSRVHTRVAEALETAPASLQLVSPSFFQVFETAPALGRLLSDDMNESAGGSPPAVVSYGYWQRRFGGAADVVGRTLTINGTSFTVIGVGPRDFAGVWLETPVDIWVPLTAQSAVNYSQNFSADNAETNKPWLPQERIWWLNVVARVPPDTAAATVGAFTASASDQGPANAPVRLQPFGHGFSTFRLQFSTPLFALGGMAALVLLIACANVANLLLARAAGRQRELALRAAIGAGRARLVQQLLTESAILVVMAGAAAVLFARWAGDALVLMATATAGGTPPFAASLDLRVWVFTAAVALVSMLIFGLMPAWRATKVDLVTSLRAGARGTVGTAIARPARLLVMMQVALSLILVAGTGLMVRSFQNLLTVDAGFDAAHLLSVTIDPRLSSRPEQPLPVLYERIVSAAAGVPGVKSVALAMCGIQNGCRARVDDIEIEGYRPRPDEQVLLVVNPVSAQYFSTVGMRIIGGRALDDRDRANGSRTAVVNRALATRYFADGQAVGRHLGDATDSVDIVGMVDDARLVSLRDEPVPTVYFSLSQRPVPARALEVRTIGDPLQVVAPLRRALAAAVPELPIEAVSPMNTRVQLNLSPERLLMLLTSGFGGLALGLAGFGLFGVMSYVVGRRTSEFGIRMALGASRGEVLRAVLRDALWLVFCGLLGGVPFMLLGGRLLATLFFGVGPYDALTLVAATGTLIVVGVLCSLAPAFRASRVDPIVALRQE